MNKLSASIITYNEEKDIRGCLEGLSWVDEIVVLDSFSNDKTIEICKEFNKVKIYQVEWHGHIKQKNIALSKTSHEWVISLDADERLDPELKQEIVEIMRKDVSKFNGYCMPRISYYLGRWIKHSGWYPNYQLRLFRKSQAYWGGRDPHDKIILNGGCEKLKGHILHYPYKDLDEHLQKISNYTFIMAKSDYECGKKPNLLKIIFLPVLKFIDMYILKAGFLDSTPGLIAAFMGGYYVFLRHAKLLTMDVKLEDNIVAK
ncbi:MAG: glycosyltransferase family 2 protein [Candidatus Omnitrophota bacterium]|jgi:glycosyltransferase involved in cell wall biosynthesis|nr:MAG: glycosyltransferase family 2 protein [Candidatus Omnitrophota bacterium]